MNIKNYYVDSIVKRISKGIIGLVENGIIDENVKILIYGADVYSFAINTVLKNHGYKAHAYVISEQLEFIRAQRSAKAAKRYMNSNEAVIDFYKLGELKKLSIGSYIILIASKDYISVKRKLETIGLEENTDFYSVCDWKDEYYDSLIGEKKEISLLEMQAIEKDILLYVDDFCNRKGIRYWVCGGTLLGTIRHKGFIPWDDDVDIFMPYQDYKVFIEKFKNERYGLLGPFLPNRNDFFELYLKVTDNRTIAREDYGFFREIHPVAIDVFPIIGLPNEEDERRLFFAEFYETVHCIWQEFYELDGDMKAYNNWNARQSAFLECYSFEDQEYVGVIDTGYKERDCTEKSVYNRTLRMPFEDIEVNVPIGFEQYLSNLYGDWRQLPPENKRISHHNMKAFWL